MPRKNRVPVRKIRGFEILTDEATFNIVPRKLTSVMDKEERRLPGGDLDPFGRAQVILPEDYFGVNVSDDGADVPIIGEDEDRPRLLTEIFCD